VQWQLVLVLVLLGQLQLVLALEQQGLQLAQQEPGLMQRLHRQ
jgi:hypothetical protein